jgi:hypothetical protein
MLFGVKLLAKAYKIKLNTALFTVTQFPECEPHDIKIYSVKRSRYPG